MEKIRVGVVGTGFAGAAHVEALRRLGYVEVVAAADSIGIQEKIARLSISHGFTDYRQMIDCMRLQAVHICTPNNTHRDIALYALSHGVNVICEKPFCCTLAEAMEMTEAAKKSGLVCAVNYHNRFYPMAYEMHRMVQAGGLGRVFTIHGSYLQDWLLYDTDFSWRLLAEQGGKTRAFSDIGSHWLDLSEFVLGQKITEVFAEFITCHPTRKAPAAPAETFSGQCPAKEFHDIAVETEDACLLTLRYSGGTVGSLVVSQVFSGAKNRLELSASGAKQAAEWSLENGSNLTLGMRDEPNKLLTKARELVGAETMGLISYPAGHTEGFPDAFKQHFHRFYQYLQNRAAPHDFATFENGYHMMLLAEKAYESAHTGRWVAIDNE